LLYDTGGDLALQEISRCKPIPKNRVEPSVEEAAVLRALEQPPFAQVRACNEIRKTELFISEAEFGVLGNSTSWGSFLSAL
jgi:hypothetical protein